MTRALTDIERKAIVLLERVACYWPQDRSVAREVRELSALIEGGDLRDVTPIGSRVNMRDPDYLEPGKIIGYEGDGWWVVRWEYESGTEDASQRLHELRDVVE